MDYKKIRALRKAAKMSQDDLAQALGLNRATVSKYETGTIEPSLAQLCKIANVLNVRVEELMGNLQGFDSSADFDKAWKNATSGNPGYEAVTVYHKPGGHIEIIDHRQERLNQIYTQLDSERQGQLVKYGEFLLIDSENE